MPHPIERKIAEVRRRARGLAALFGAGRVVAFVVAAVVAVGLLDYLVRFEDRGLRIMSSLFVAALVLWTVYHYLLRGLLTRLDDVDVALRIERRYPHLNDRLASAVQFLRQAEDEPYAGSAALRRAVVIQTEQEAEKLHWRDLFDLRPVRRSVIAGGAMSIVALAVVLCDPTSARVAVARLIHPLEDIAWPQKNHLVFRQAIHRLAIGRSLELEVVDAEGAELPSDVRLEYRYEGSSTVEQVDMVRLGDAMVGRLEGVIRPFAYRAVGGDDRSMPWVELEVVEPPALDTLTVMVHYPEYTSWPPRRLERHLRALVGTRVEMQGTTTKPIHSATIALEDGANVPAEVAPDGLGFALAANADPAFVIARSGSYRILLEDSEGLVGGEDTRYEVRAVADLPPHVSMEQPEANIYVTAEAVVPVRVTVKDDLAIHDAWLRYRRLDTALTESPAAAPEPVVSVPGKQAQAEGEGAAAQEPAQESEPRFESLPLYAGPPAAPAPTAEMLAATTLPGETRSLEYAWDLASLNLPRGAQLDFWSAASDYQPQGGESPPRRITIISPAELQDRLAERQKFILGELSRVMKLERDARNQVKNLEIQLNEVGQLKQQDLDHLQGAELAQRQVDRELSSPHEGVQAQIAGLLEDLRNNKVDSPDLERRMSELSKQLEQVAADHLPEIARELTNALKQGQAEMRDEGDARATSDALARAGQQQDAVLASLERMLGDLSQWDNYRRFHREVGALQREQQALTEETARLGRETVSLDAQELTPQQQADLKKLGARQVDLARRLEALEQQMSEAKKTLAEEDPLAADTLNDAVHASRQSGLGGAMRDAARHVEGNQIGQAAQQHQQIAENLQEMLDVLSNRRENELERLVAKLREAEKQLAKIEQEQEGLRKRMQKAAQIPNAEERRRELERLTRRQQELQQEAERLARRLQRLQANDAAQSMARAGSSMQQAGQQGEQGDAGEASQGAQRAERDLEAAQEQLAQARQQAEADLAFEQLRRMRDELAALRDSQQGVQAETVRLDELRKEKSNLTRAQILSLRELARQQATLEAAAAELAERLSAAAAFRLALQGAGRDMRRAADLLERRETGLPAQRAVAQALTRLAQLVSALDLAKDDPGGQQQDDQQGGEGQTQNQSEGDAIANVSQLKLIKLMQEEINRRTLEMDDAYQQNGSLTEDQQVEYTALGQEQGELADLLQSLIERAPAPEEPDELDLERQDPAPRPGRGTGEPDEAELELELEP
ncbi:MAG: hypothetical protein KF708_08200 [Pirellulales bacterium]|nr:hypothetical protein [Pirellulales bacterium]